MVVPGLGHEADGLGLGADQILQARIIGDGTPCPLHHAEGGEGGLGFPVLAEKRGIGRIGAGIAALDVIDAQSSSSISMTTSLSSSEKSTPGVCWPSRKVVSKR